MTASSPASLIRRASVALATLMALAGAGVADAAITEVAATVGASANGSAVSVAVPVPAGTAANDVLLVQVAASRNGETISPPAGWTAIRSDGQSFFGFGVTQALFYRVATGSEPASYTFGLSTAAGAAGSMVAFRGVDTGAPILGNSGQGGAVLLDTAPGIASCTAGTMQVAFFGFSAGVLGVTLGGGITPYGSTSTNALVGLTLVNGGATMASAGACPANTALAVSVTANIGQQVALTPAQAVTGAVYGDANHDATQNSEVGIGQTTYVKLASGSPGSCASPALQVATVNAATGAYTFPFVNAGSYCLIESTNATLGDVMATSPSGFVRTETPGGIRAVTVASSAVTAQNFGLYAGSTLAGRVFNDNGAGGGTPNDGVVNGTEPGLVGAAVTVMSGATTLATLSTDATGAYVAWLPSTTSGTISVVATPPAGTVAVGGSPGTTGGTYVRATATTSFTFASGQSWSGIVFGDVTANAFAPNNATTAGPGATVPYAHAFVAGSTGLVTVTTSATSTPTASWTQVLIRDTNCNGVVDVGETAVAGAIPVVAGQTVCIVVLDTIPAAAGNGAQDVVTVQAAFAYTNASPALTITSTRTDTTTVSTTILLQIGKQVRNVTQATGSTTTNVAKPNDVLEYRLGTTNPASSGVTGLFINDVVPTYTRFVSATCPSPLPAGITACTVSTQPAAGSTGPLQWTLVGTLAGGAQFDVTFQVQVDP